jgi:predicted transcriptional regulator of viral defense system
MYEKNVHTGCIFMTEGIDPALAELRKRAKGNELTYGFVMDCLSFYRSPREKLTRLLRSKALIRVKKGLYVFSELNTNGYICKELLANLIHGPSYVSLEWAMAYYNLIPEAVYGITSVTVKQKKHFDSPLGRFSYEHCHPKRYPVGIEQKEVSPYQRFLIATPEKALVDLLIIRRGWSASLKEMQEILFEDFRIEEEDLMNLELLLIREIYHSYPHSAVEYLIKVMEKMKS